MTASPSSFPREETSSSLPSIMPAIDRLVALGKESERAAPPNKLLKLATVLLVDDEPEFLKAISRDLRALGFGVVTASDAAIAQAMLEVRRFDAVVTDLNLPTDLDVMFARAATRTAPDTPVVVLTGEDSLRSVMQKLGDAPIERVLSKPCTRRDLSAALERAIVRARSGATDGLVEAKTVAMGLVRALALRDIETENHSQRVAAWARMLGKAVGLVGDVLLQAELGALLHDIGKIGVPDSILRKPGKLDEDEWVEMRKHPIYGREMLAGITALAGAAEVVENHHERWDGAGYPRGLREHEIPIGARIFAVVDTYDAMTNDRVYRKGMPHEFAVEELRRLAGIQYDPSVVEAFLAIDPDLWRSVRDKFAEQKWELDE